MEQSWQTRIVFVLSAPSGAGKTTVLRRLLEEVPGLVFAVSHTTRPPREGERPGVHYHFVDRETFCRIRDRRPPGFLEWAEVHGHFYGTSRQEVFDRLAGGDDVMLDIDVQGASQVRQQLPCVTVFLAPPSREVLAARLHGRGTDSEEVIERRLAAAAREMAASGFYDYVVVNDELELAVAQLRAIVWSERCRRRRWPDGRALALQGWR